MILDKQESKLFYDLMWSLQYYINQKLNIIPAIKSLDDYIALDMNQKLLVRNALYEHINLCDEYVTDNPQKFSADELTQVMDWKKFVKGHFYIERYLKKYSIFIGPEDKVYTVHSLQQPLDEIIHKSYLPHAVEAVLLPFAGKIIYDGLLLNYSVHFGSGISGDLKEVYLIAKSKGDIIESLTAQQKQQPTPTVLKNWQTEMQNLSSIAQSLRGGQGQPAYYSPVFSLIKASIELGELATTAPSDTDALWKAFDRVSRSLDKTEKTLHRME
ncbi:MAG: hypothetical protein ACXWTS_00580 [Methylococcaceae bacterium]